MRRTLGEPVSALSIDSQNNIIAGGWNGRLTKWDASGDEIWTGKLPDRIGCIAINEDSVYATAAYIWLQSSHSVEKFNGSMH